MDVVVLVPAYKPPAALPEFVAQLIAAGFGHVIVVDDGSGPAFAALFDRIAGVAGATLLRHGVNLGKGAALKTGLNHAYCGPPMLGVVTADADGQHAVKDIVAVAQRLRDTPDALVIGTRRFVGEVPWRSRLGNSATRLVFRLLVGKKLQDTQSGLRGIPRDYIPRLLRIEATGYEFELDMLITCKHGQWPIAEQPIETIYLEGNKSSHFDPLWDSMKIYFVLLRFMAASLATGAIDYTVFIIAFGSGLPLFASQYAARGVALTFNYLAVKRFVFYSGQKHAQVFPKYLLLVAGAGLVSYYITVFLVGAFAISVIAAKLFSELLLYLANFAIQRDLIFTAPAGRPAMTDWNRYYSRPFKASSVTRRITQRVLIEAIKRYAVDAGRGKRLLELGGANSFFFERIRAEVAPAEYHVLDNNATGLAKFRERIGADLGVSMHHDDLFQSRLQPVFPVVFSVGLIEHFDVERTRRAIERHFALAEAGGLVLISYPTPTWLYRLARSIAEGLNLWIFHDERPLRREEVAGVAAAFGEILYEKIIWPIVFTQRLMVVRKHV